MPPFIVQAPKKGAMHMEDLIELSKDAFKLPNSAPISQNVCTKVSIEVLESVESGTSHGAKTQIARTS